MIKLYFISEIFTFDKIFNQCKPVSLYGPHGLRSGLGLLLRLFSVDDAEIMRYIYWKSLESLDLYTYGFELSEARKLTRNFLVKHGLKIGDMCIRELLQYLISNVVLLEPLFNEYRTFRFLQKYTFRYKIMSFGLNELFMLLRIDITAVKRPNSTTSGKQSITADAIVEVTENSISDVVRSTAKRKPFKVGKIKNIKVFS